MVDSSLTSIASQLLNFRNRRYHYFGDAMFGEAAWQILLALYAAGGAGDFPWVLQNSRVQPSTTKRWIDFLERAGFVRRQAANDTEFEVFELTPKAEVGLDNLLREFVEAFSL
jgi:DNA-binding MarR family transcriptional regulator